MYCDSGHDIAECIYNILVTDYFRLIKLFCFTARAVVLSISLITIQ